MRFTEIQTDRTLYPLESPILGYLPEFASGTSSALVTGVEADVIVNEISNGLKNYAVDIPDYYLRHMSKKEAEQRQLYFENIASKKLGEVALEAV